MDNGVSKYYGSRLISEGAKENAREYVKTNRKTRRKIEEGFFNRAIDYREYVFSPSGYEGPALAFYIAVIPYLAGLAFLFLFIAEGSMEYFIGFTLTSYFIIWAIGYEVCAVLTISAIFLSWINYQRQSRKAEKNERKPMKRKGF